MVIYLLGCKLGDLFVVEYELVGLLLWIEDELYSRGGLLFCVDEGFDVVIWFYYCCLWILFIFGEYFI